MTTTKKKSAGKKLRPGIQSVEIASRILAALAAPAQPLPLKEIAQGCSMPAAKVHRYLVSLTRTGLVAQDSDDSRYGIGPASIALGLAGLHGIDAVRIASEALIGLRDTSGETAVLATWSSAGPVIVRIEESSRPVFMNVRVGSTLPLLKSAVGLIFAAYLPAHEVAALFAQESRGPSRSGKVPTLEALRRETRRHTIGAVDGDLVPGVTALAAPIFDHRGRIAASIALLGGAGHLTANTNSDAAKLLQKTAAAISRRLGFVALRE